MWINLTEEQAAEAVLLALGAKDTDLANKIQHYIEINDNPKNVAFRAAADLTQIDGELEFDDDALVSLNNKGAYVMGWAWVSNKDAAVAAAWPQPPYLQR